MRFVEVNRTATLKANLDMRPSSAGTFIVSDRSGGAVQASTVPTLNAVSTTLSVAANAGDQTLTLTSATSVVVGNRYLLGGTEATGGEFVTVKSIASNVVTLVRRIITSKASGASFVSTEVSFPIAAISGPGRAYRVEYTYDSNRPSFVLPFDVTRWTPVSYLTIEDLRDIDPNITKKLPAGIWLPAMMNETWEILQNHIASKVDPGGVVGSVDLTTAHGYLLKAILAESAGTSAEVTTYRDMMYKRYLEERDNSLSNMSYDEYQTGKASMHRGYYRNIKLVRG